MMREKNLARATICAFLAIVLVGAALILVSRVDASAVKQCQKATVQVRLAPGDSRSYKVVGWLCSRGRTRGKAVQVLLSGLTYSHRYWSMPYQPGAYSYVDAALAGGYATFMVDRIGTGVSDQPPADLVTVPAQAYIAHQVVQMLRRGDIGDVPFDRVIGVGHSLGAAVWMIEAELADVDGLILGSYLHRSNAVQQQVIAASLRPAQEEKRFAGRPEGYFTTAPGTRLANFYYRPGADPGMVALDETYKDTGTLGEQATLSLARDPAYSQRIRVPVLLVVGQQDSLACDETQGAALSCGSSRTICAREAAFFPAAPLSAAVIPEAGHAIALHRTARSWMAVAGRWADDLVAAKLTHRTCEAR